MHFANGWSLRIHVTCARSTPRKLQVLGVVAIHIGTRAFCSRITLNALVFFPIASWVVSSWEAGKNRTKEESLAFVVHYRELRNTHDKVEILWELSIRGAPETGSTSFIEDMKMCGLSMIPESTHKEDCDCDICSFSVLEAKETCYCRANGCRKGFSPSLRTPKMTEGLRFRLLSK